MSASATQGGHNYRIRHIQLCLTVFIDAKNLLTDCTLHICEKEGRIQKCCDRSAEQDPDKFMGSTQGWTRDVNGRDRDETETRRLQVSRRYRDVEVHVYYH